MEYLIFVLFVLGFIVILMAAGWIQEKRQEKDFIKKLEREYGVLPKREYQPQQFQNISRYFLNHQTGFFLDEITWNDLEMNELFKRMNHTWSSAGEEYLYYTLRTPSIREEELKKREEIISFFLENDTVRTAWQFIFARLGRTGKYSIYDYLNNLETLGHRSNKRHYLAIGAFVISIVSLYFSVTFGLLLLVGILSFNLTVYFKIKKDTEPYLISFAYIFRLLHCGEKMEKEKVPLLKEPLEELARCRLAFRKFKRGSYLLMSPARMSASGNPLEVVLDYLRMGLHLDLIQFNHMLSQVRKHTTEIDRMLTIIGSIETAIAIGAFRKSIHLEGKPGYAIPEFHSAVKISARGMYHPLLSHPITNDMDTDRSVLLTGSNASGKSTFLKTVAVNAILAQTVYTCLAEHYRGGMYQIASSMSLRDALLEGDSYYMVEIKSMKRLLDMGKENSHPALVFVDEVLRGTNTVERIAASTQILRSLNKEGSLCFAATHDMELTYLLEKEYANYHFKEEFHEGDISFPYQIQHGPATTRNAIKLLEAIGYETALIEDAERLAEGFMESGKWERTECK